MIESITSTVTQLNSLFASLTLFVPTVIGLFAVISAAFPKPREGSPLEKIYRVVNWLGFNFGHAKNQ